MLYCLILNLNVILQSTMLIFLFSFFFR